MAYQPFHQCPRTALQQVRIIATDMDGTLTHGGQFSGLLLDRLERLGAAGIEVVIVTGRSAGWVSAIAHYLPIRGAIAENGGLFMDGPEWGGGWRSLGATDWLQDTDALRHHRQALAQQFMALQRSLQDPSCASFHNHSSPDGAPLLRESSDNRFRLSDWTFDLLGVTAEQLQACAIACAQAGWGFTYSTVQAHIALLGQDKQTGLSQFLSSASLLPSQILTLGDSPNDAPLFNPRYFPLSVGVANVQHYRQDLPHLPCYVTEEPEVLGFCAIADQLLSL